MVNQEGIFWLRRSCRPFIFPIDIPIILCYIIGSEVIKKARIMNTQFSLPSLEESSRRQIVNADAIKKFMLAGSAVFTLVSVESGVRYTYKVTKKDSSDDFWFVNRLSGPDNYDDFFYIGHIRMVYHNGIMFKPKDGREHELSVRAFKWFFGNLYANPDKAIAFVEFWHEGRCGRCKRRLTVPESIASGFGPECINYV